MNENKCTALVPIQDTKKEKRKFPFDKYRKEGKAHILFIRLYLLFFFFGVCVFASQKWGAMDLATYINEKVVVETNSFGAFCLKFAPLVFGSFLVYAAGFTLYAPLVSALYISAFSFVCGILGGKIIYDFGFGFDTIGVLALLGLLEGMCILLCSMSKGIYKIASSGIGNLSISDGILYTVVYLASVFAQYKIIGLIVSIKL